MSRRLSIIVRRALNVAVRGGEDTLIMGIIFHGAPQAKYCAEMVDWPTIRRSTALCGTADKWPANDWFRTAVQCAEFLVRGKWNRDAGIEGRSEDV